MEVVTTFRSKNHCFPYWRNVLSVLGLLTFLWGATESASASARRTWDLVVTPQSYVLFDTDSTGKRAAYYMGGLQLGLRMGLASAANQRLRHQFGLSVGFYGANSGATASDGTSLVSVAGLDLFGVLALGYHLRIGLSTNWYLAPHGSVGLLLTHRRAKLRVNQDQRSAHTTIAGTMAQGGIEAGYRMLVFGLSGGVLWDRRGVAGRIGGSVGLRFAISDS